jgi:hypothetical protein
VVEALVEIMAGAIRSARSLAPELDLDEVLVRLRAQAVSDK